MIRRTFGGLGLTMALLGATLIFASPAYAWNTTLTGSAVCNRETGTFDVTWHIVNNEAHNVMHVASASGNGQPPSLVGAAVPAAGSIDRVLANQSPGTYTLNIGVTWQGSTETDTATATVQTSNGTSGACMKATTTTTSTTTTSTTSTTSTTTTSTTAPTTTTTIGDTSVRDTSITRGPTNTGASVEGTSTGPTVLGLVVTKQPAAPAVRGVTAAPAVLASTGPSHSLPFATIGLVLVALGVCILAIAARHERPFAEVSARLRSLL
jgi:hypothetical protein